MMILLLSILIAVILIESILRFFQLGKLPLNIKLAHALYLLNSKSLKENILIQQRIDRGGFQTEDQLFEHYAKISGKTKENIKEKCSRPDGMSKYFAKSYHSGIHGLIELEQQMNLGSVCKPDLSLTTVSTGKDGFRSDTQTITSADKKCLLLGGSVAFGVGATSDEYTIASQLEEILNNNKNNTSYSVKNAGMLGFNSYQELIYLLNTKEKFDYVIALSAWNDLDQSLFANSKVPFLARSCDSRANKNLFLRIISDFINKWVTIQVFKRFLKAYINYDHITTERKTSDNPDIYPMF